jgi:hypothetical protein
MTQNEGNQHEQSEVADAESLFANQGSKGRPFYHEQESNDSAWSDDANDLVSVERLS